MKGVLCGVLCVLGATLVSSYPYPQQQPLVVPPHLLRQYLTQKQQQERASRPESTPIYEQDSSVNAAPQYVQREQSQPQYVSQYLQPQQQYVQQPQPQYIAQPRPQQLKRPKPKPQQVQQALDEEDAYDDPNATYQFGFDVNDDQYTNYQNRQEERQNGVIKGSYSVVDSDGFIRTVTYTADPKEGFKAEVVRKPTDIVVKIPTPQPQTIEPQGRPHHQYQLEEAPQQQRYARPQQIKQQQPQQQYYTTYQQ